jgi:hypothetical protein
MKKEESSYLYLVLFHVLLDFYLFVPFTAKLNGYSIFILAKHSKEPNESTDDGSLYNKYYLDDGGGISPMSFIVMFFVL